MGFRDYTLKMIIKIDLNGGLHNFNPLTARHFCELSQKKRIYTIYHISNSTSAT